MPPVAEKACGKIAKCHYLPKRRQILFCSKKVEIAFQNNVVDL
jgi:hypothetical protein